MPTTTTRSLRPHGKVLPGDVRATHRSMVLQHLLHSGPGSRADLARSTGLTRVTVSDLVSELLAEGLVAELGQESEEGKVGKRGMLVGLRTEAFQIVAVDLRDDQLLHGALVDLSGAVVEQRSARFTDPQGEVALADLTAFCRELLGAATRPVLGVGVASPGIVDSAGTVLEAPNRDWYDLPLARTLTAALGVPVHVGNDADAAALGEWTYGGASGGGMLVLTVGQGVGAGIVVDGALVQGHGHAAGELGHVTAVDDRDAEGSSFGPPLPCACGRVGCLETVLAKPALRRRVAGLDPEATDAALASVGRRLGIVLAPVVGALNLAEVVLSGPPELLGGPLLDTALAVIRERTMPVSSRGLRMRVTTLGEAAPLSGAAVLVLSGQLGVT